MNLDVFSYTDIGSRTLNEDYYNIKKSDNRFIAVLCDGLGGHNCGEVASKTAADNIVEGLTQTEELDLNSIYKVLSVVNEGIIKQQIENPDCNGMRTTTVGCILSGRTLNYFNVGDSRFYLFRKGVLNMMSKDHSVSQMSVELGEMSFDNIRGDADRNKLLKVLGERMDGEVGTIYRPVEVCQGDAFLLCSDGFWEYILEEEMEIDLSKSQTSEEWIKYMLVRLLLRMNGNNDNFTVIGGIIK